ncbi:hypothetical protein PR048_001326 [Dryococelus australis]|uniref:Uncharacterized protein n=1 Tax=Dryococelus australis TaxID=614101 RepID=A0ABQ9IH25_9NEOP|nr:hypothetical protein PR048_001326 [Dryococelus australis]
MPLFSLGANQRVPDPCRSAWQPEDPCDPGVGVDAFFHAIYTQNTRMVMLLGSACSDVTESLANVMPYWNIAQVVERLARSPSTKANRAQSPAGPPDFRKWESCRTMPLVGGSSRGFHPPLHSGAAPYSLQSPSSALKTPLLRATQISSLFTRVAQSRVGMETTSTVNQQQVNYVAISSDQHIRI